MPRHPRPPCPGGCGPQLTSWPGAALLFRRRSLIRQHCGSGAPGALLRSSGRRGRRRSRTSGLPPRTRLATGVTPSRRHLPSRHERESHPPPASLFARHDPELLGDAVRVHRMAGNRVGTRRPVRCSLRKVEVSNLGACTPPGFRSRFATTGATLLADVRGAA